MSLEEWCLDFVQRGKESIVRVIVVFVQHRSEGRRSVVGVGVTELEVMFANAVCHCFVVKVRRDALLTRLVLEENFYVDSEHHAGYA